jgi:type VI secretion system protein ImpH
MAGSDRAAAGRVTLLAELSERPCEFDFYKALRKLEAAFPDRPRLGRSHRAGEDPVRLAQQPSLAFAPSTVAAFQQARQGGPHRLTVWFGGLLGANGPLPLHLTEYARDRTRNANDWTFVRFLDVFHHRMLSLFYRVWADAQPTVHFDRPASDRFAAYVGSLVGIGLPSLQNRDAMSDLAKLSFAGRLVCQTRHAEGLQALLGDFFELPMRIAEFVGQWLPLPDDCRCVLGVARDSITGSSPRSDELQTAQLGVSATIGDRVWDCQTKFRIVAGPLGFADYQRLLPGGESLQRLIAIVKNYAGLELDWELHLLLHCRAVPRTQLGSLGQLGWTTWLVSKPAKADAGDLMLTPQAA